MKRKNDAFTLIEILVVVILVGIMAAIVIPQFTDASDDARENRDVMNLRILQNAVDYCHYETGAFPATLDALVTAGYLRSVPEGTWGYDAGTGVVSAPE
ncbi:MAG: prepilin-type N-terminal cleavage/methylation domain-containing protein [Phycisphaerae bacterium]|nr:prepilin-type N-terminal cleavage/methylation domain-containing protein [Phycisphaerae bacterium]